MSWSATAADAAPAAADGVAVATGAAWVPQPLRPTAAAIATVTVTPTPADRSPARRDEPPGLLIRQLARAEPLALKPAADLIELTQPAGRRRRRIRPRPQPAAEPRRIRRQRPRHDRDPDLLPHRFLLPNRGTQVREASTGQPRLC